jgi:hypothetical protein
LAVHFGIRVSHGISFLISKIISILIFSHSEKPLNPPWSPFSKGEKMGSFPASGLKSSPPFEKGGREGFLNRNFKKLK